jgi:hypothetical protein
MPPGAAPGLRGLAAASAAAAVAGTAAARARVRLGFPCAHRFSFVGGDKKGARLVYRGPGPRHPVHSITPSRQWQAGQPGTRAHQPPRTVPSARRGPPPVLRHHPSRIRLKGAVTTRHGVRRGRTGGGACRAAGNRRGRSWRGSPRRRYGGYRPVHRSIRVPGRGRAPAPPRGGPCPRCARIPQPQDMPPPGTFNRAGG